MTQTVGVGSFRQNIRVYLDKCDETPIVIHRHNKNYILMKQEHYIDLINKIKLPNVVEMPAFVQTIVHFGSVSR